VSRLNSDVIEAQQAITSTLSGVVSNIVTLVAILVTMFYLSWLVTAIALLVIPLFILSARLVGRRLQVLTRESILDSQRLTALHFAGTLSGRINV
jgi:ATP-binding cassette subfamily B protein